MQEEYFTIDEIAQYLKLSKGTVYILSQRGKIPCCKIGKRLRFKKSSIDRWTSEKEKKRERMLRRRSCLPASV